MIGISAGVAASSAANKRRSSVNEKQNTVIHSSVFFMAIYKQKNFFSREFLGYLHSANPNTLNYNKTSKIDKRMIWDWKFDSEYERAIELEQALNNRYNSQGLLFKLHTAEALIHITYDSKGNKHIRYEHW